MQSRINYKRLELMMHAGIAITTFGCVLGCATMMIERLFNLYFSMTGVVIIICGMASLVQTFKRMEAAGVQQPNTSGIGLSIALGASLAVLVVSIANRLQLLG